MATYFPWVFTLIAFILSLLRVHDGEPFVESYVASIVLMNGGVQGLWASIGHLFFPKEVAKTIGWSSNGFQTEIGGANFAIGVTAILSYVIHSWIHPVALILALFYGVCAYAHIKDHTNTAPCNRGPMLYNTIFVSLTLLIALVFNTVVDK